VVEALIAEWDEAPAFDRIAPCHSSMSGIDEAALIIAKLTTRY